MEVRSVQLDSRRAQLIQVAESLTRVPHSSGVVIMSRPGSHRSSEGGCAPRPRPCAAGGRDTTTSSTTCSTGSTDLRTEGRGPRAEGRGSSGRWPPGGHRS